MTLSINSPSSVFRVQQVNFHELFTSPCGLAYSSCHLFNFDTSLSIKKNVQLEDLEFVATENSLIWFESLDWGQNEAHYGGGRVFHCSAVIARRFPTVL